MSTAGAPLLSLLQALDEPSPPSEVFREIACHGVDGAPALVPFLFTEGPSSDAAGAMRDLLAGFGALDFVALDQAVRERFVAYGTYIEGNYRLTPAELVRLGSWGDGAVLGPISCHPGGYIREPLVALLAAIRDGSEVPFLLLRLNDWVTPIRGMAERAVIDRLVAPYAPHFARHLALVEHLSRCERSEAGGVPQRVMEFLRGHPGSLEGAIRARSPRMVRARFRLLVEAAPGRAVELGLASNFPGFALEAARLARKLYGARIDDRLVTTMRASRFPHVRCEGLLALADRTPEAAEEAMREALLDEAMTVREEARFWYKKKTPAVDVAAISREAIEAPGSLSRLRGAMLALGETGTKDDAARLLPAVDHELSSVRAAALRAILRLDADGHVPLLLGQRGRGPGKITRMLDDALRSRRHLLPTAG